MPRPARQFHALAALLRALVLALSLVGASVQGVLVQSHSHLQATALADEDGPSAAPLSHAACLLCEFAGHAPAYAPPVDSGFPARVPTVAHPAPVGLAAAHFSRPHHHWLGRGPPLA